MRLKYKNENKIYEVSFKKISKNVVELTGDFPIQTDGFTLSREGKNDNWDYSSYTTVYKELENCCQFSNDGSVYVEPEVIEPIEPSEPYVPIEERLSTIENELTETQIAITEVYEMMLGV